ncbi:MAG: hypothetical protein GXP47_05125 [Acidobacteria bacterium]|nr:hypothetical protein [Acidobacteriota bacterium]
MAGDDPQAAEQIHQVIRQIDEALGLSLRNDILASLGSELGVWTSVPWTGWPAP